MWGESSGAISVGSHLLAYNGRDDQLFSKAIAESGPTFGVGLVNPTIDIAEQVYQNVTSAANCSSVVDKLACLRSVPTEVLNGIFNNSADTEDYHVIYYGPLVDGDIISRNAVDQLKDGSFVRVPYIMGDNSDEGTDFGPFGLNSNADVTTYLQGYNLSNEVIHDILQLYPENSTDLVLASHPAQFNTTIGTHFKQSATILTDILFKAPRRLTARYWTQHTASDNTSEKAVSSNASLYTYRFNTIPNSVPDFLGVTHFTEVAFVFHNIRGRGYPDVDPPYFGADPFANKPATYVTLSDTMSRMWIAFIHDGNPNYPGYKGPKWPAYNSSHPVDIVFDGNLTSPYLEMDTYRQKGISYLMQQYDTPGNLPWSLHEVTKKR